MLWPVLAGVLAVSAPLPAQVPLYWHAETLDGQVIESSQGDEPVNPASVVKVATSLWALERLGASHRFETRFGYRGSLDRSTGILDGDLVVTGGGDPDFHVENAFLVARALNEQGVRQVTGRLVVDDIFWIGWEGGSDRRERDPTRRRTLMARRLAQALDSARWSPETRKTLAALMARRGLDPAHPARVVIQGRTGTCPAEDVPKPLVTHRSKPLVRVLKRLNAYSNNDIERLEASLGPVVDLATELARRWGLPAGSVQFSTYSGLGENRMTPRQLVRLLGEVQAACQHEGIQLADVLPVAGCDPGTLAHFPRLDELRGVLVAKTGTLTTTDGGVAALAGCIHTAAGERLFSVVSPGTGYDPSRARLAQAKWLRELAGPAMGAHDRACVSSVSGADDDAQIVLGP